MIPPVANSHSYRFCLPQTLSPTYFNISQYLLELGWENTPTAHHAHFSESHFQFDEYVAQTLEYKHLLAQLIVSCCPQVMPETYCINDSNWRTVVEILAKQYYTRDLQNSDYVQDLVWILKPSLLNNGQEIQIFTHLSQLQQHYLKTNRLGGEHVLQRYISHPDLINGYKYSIRMFVVLTNYAGAYLYPQGYCNVAQQAYPGEDISDLRPHLTNEHLNDNADGDAIANVVQTPTTQFDFFAHIYPQIKSILSTVLTGLRQSHPSAFVYDRQRKLAIFGFDFMADAEQRLWLLEANHGPCFPVSATHPLQLPFYDAFWRACIASFIVPIATQQAHEKVPYHPFEVVLSA